MVQGSELPAFEEHQRKQFPGSRGSSYMATYEALAPDQ